MKRDVIFGRLTQVRGYCKTLWARFVGDYPGLVAGKRIEIAGRLQAARAALAERRAAHTRSAMTVRKMVAAAWDSPLMIDPHTDTSEQSWWRNAQTIVRRCGTLQTLC
jgi:hypothetical protein